MVITLENVESAIIGAGIVLLATNAFVSYNRMNENSDNRIKEYLLRFKEVGTNLRYSFGFEDRKNN